MKTITRQTRASALKRQAIAAPHALARGLTALGVIALSPTILCAQTSAPAPVPFQRVEVSGGLSEDDPSVAGSALRTVVPIEKTPQSVVVITRALTDEQGARTLGEALSNAVSVRTTDARDQLNFGPRIRGFEAGVLLDGVALPGSFTTPELLTGVSRVEVVKGPTGSLFGGSQTAGNAGFIGGQIAVNTAAPQRKFAASAAIRAGTQNQTGFAADLNAPLSSSLAFRIDVETTREDSETDRVRHQRLAVQPSLAWRPNDNSELIVRYRRTETEGIDYSGLPRKGTIEAASYVVPRSRIITAEGLPDSGSNLDVLNLHWTQRLSNRWTFQLVAATVRADYDQRGTFALDSTTFAFPARSALDGPVYALSGARLWNRQASKVISPSIIGKLEAAGAVHTLTAGVDVDRTRDDAFLVFSPNFGLLGFLDVTNPVYPQWNEPIAPSTPDQKNRYRSNAAYVQNLADFGRWQLLTSVRHSQVKVTDVNPAFLVSNETKHDKSLGRIGAVVEIAKGVSAFAGWGQSMRVPTFAVFTNPPKPELADQLEVGVRLADWRGLSGTVAYFDLSLKNGLQPDPVNLGQTIQVGREKSRGIDIDLQWRLARNTQVLASVSHISTEVVDTGKRFVDIPRTAARIAVRHELDGSGPFAGLGVGLGLTHHSALDGDAANTYQTPAATVWDAQLSYRIGKGQLGLVARNLADKQYWVPSRYFGGGQVTPAPRRSVAVTASWQF